MAAALKIGRRGFLQGTVATGAGLFFAGRGVLTAERFGALPSGERLGRIQASPHYRDGMFRNEEPLRYPVRTAEPDRGGLASMLFHRSALNLVPPTGAVPVVRSDLRSLPRDRDALVWFGHSSCFLQLDGVRILVDPVFYTASPFAFLFGEAFPGTNVHTPADLPDMDVLLITHDHWDHLDHRTVTEMRDRIGQVVCPLGVGAHFERWGFAANRLAELDWDEDFTLSSADGGKTVFHCLPSCHFSGRSLTRNQTLWASFLVAGASRKVYFAGDGGYDGRFQRIHARFPDIDLALLENGQYNVRWPVVHTLPEALPLEMLDLGARRYMTVHHGKFSISTHAWDDPYRHERKAARVADVPLLTPEIGAVTFL